MVDFPYRMSRSTLDLRAVNAHRRVVLGPPRNRWNRCRRAIVTPSRQTCFRPLLGGFIFSAGGKAYP
jgi:hypothetical protein